MTAAIGEQIATEIERLDGLLRAQQARIDSLLAQTDLIPPSATRSRPRLAAAEGAGGLPLAGRPHLAVLAGAAAGFAMAWLAGRPRPEGDAQPSSARSRPGVTCSWRRRPKRATRSGAGPPPPTADQRFTLVVDEDIRPPQRMVDELEPLGGDLGA